MNKRYVVASAALLLMAGSLVYAGDADHLIELDKMWGETSDAGKLDSLLSDEIVVLDPDGNGTKASVIENATNADAPSEPYTAGDYVVKFISDDIAIMTHSTAGAEQHWSMHVWQKDGGKWKVAATASIPAAE